MNSDPQENIEKDWIEAELEDSLDEELELELDDLRIPTELRSLIGKKQKRTLQRRYYFKHLI